MTGISIQNNAERHKTAHLAENTGSRDLLLLGSTCGHPGRDGWLDYHLHQFDIINPATGMMAEIGIPDDEFGGISSLIGNRR